MPPRPEAVGYSSRLGWSRAQAQATSRKAVVTALASGPKMPPVIHQGAASILAKVARDRFMCELEVRYPGYGFAGHKGYGTPEHLDALRRLGPSPVHRRSFAPVQSSLPR